MDPVSQLNDALTGRYEIEKEIGAGGMATVFLARDVRHNRNVALKLLKPELGVVLGADRFLAEIQVTANLQHPNLLPLFDSGEAGGLLFYVMPFVEGETLRARLDREKQLPVEEAVRITVAIAGALAYAHAHGVIHRDLKPENILMQAGQPVIADFGIALAVSNAGGARITQTGLSLGTPLYMSPEQATGDRAIDGRTDVYSLAAMLYEMLTGDPPHTASTSQGIIAKVLTDRPRGVRGVRSSVPEYVEAAIDRALEKLPADRWANAQEFLDALQGRGFSGSTVRTSATSLAGAQSAGRSRFRDPVFVTLGVVAVAALAIAGVAAIHIRGTPAVIPVRFSLTPDTTATPIFNGTWSALPSPDGRSIVFTAISPGGTPQLWIRRLDQLTARPIPGSERGTQPLFSPDGKWIAFLSDSRLRKVSVEGGSPVPLADAGANNGADWVTNDLMVFGAEGIFRGLSQLSSSGGSFRELTRIDTTKGEATHLWPVSLSDRNTILLTIYDGKSRAGSHIGITSLKDPKVTNLGVVGIAPIGVFENLLVYLQGDGTVMAVPIDVGGRRVTGSPVPILDSIPICGTCNGDAAVRASRAGTLAYMRGSTLGRLVWVEKGGSVKQVRNEFAAYSNPRLSPDGNRIAMEIDGSIWMLTISNGTLSRITQGGVAGSPEWTPDGKSLVYNSAPAERLQEGGLWRQAVDGSGTPEKLVPGAYLGGVVSPDGKELIYTVFSATTDLYIKSTTDTAKGRPFLATPRYEGSPRFSPNGRWVVYQSDETGMHEVYVRPHPGDGGRVQISTGGGTEPRWSADGRRIFYRTGQRMMAANITETGTINVGSRDTLFTGRYVDANGSVGTTYDVSRDGTRFLMVKGNESSMQVIVVVNWLDELKARLGKK